MNWDSLKCAHERCKSSVVGIYDLPKGCACIPDKHRQALCSQHVVSCTPVAGMTTVAEKPGWENFSKERVNGR